MRPTDSQEKYLEYLIQIRLSHLLLIDDHNHRCRNSYNSMAQITEHDSEQERERDDGVERWVDLLVGRDAVCIDHCLEALGELIRAVVRRRLLVCAQLV